MVNLIKLVAFKDLTLMFCHTEFKINIKSNFSRFNLGEKESEKILSKLKQKN